MKSAGIIAEYNPFHNGHLYQIQTLRKQGVNVITVALSGSFVQRGTPAWTDKYLRTRMALDAGADFVFELPTRYAVSSAKHFAYGGVSLLSALSLDYLCFGAETDDINWLQSIADYWYLHESADDPLQIELQKNLQQGDSYPIARQKVLSQHLSELNIDRLDLLSSPNNILALEYLQAIKSLKSPLKPLAIRRSDAGYHSQHITGALSSASSIRSEYSLFSDLSSCQQALPESVYALLLKHTDRFPVDGNDLSAMLYLRLRQAADWTEYMQYGDISSDLARRIWKLLPEYTTATEFIQILKTKNLTYSRISRCLTQLLLSIPAKHTQAPAGSVPYLRLLGMNPAKSSLLRQITDLPVITKVADATTIITKYYDALDLETQKKQSMLSQAIDCFQTDLLAADLYRQIVFQKLGVSIPDEYRAGILLSR